MKNNQTKTFVHSKYGDLSAIVVNNEPLFCVAQVVGMMGYSIDKTVDAHLENNKYKCKTTVRGIAGEFTFVTLEDVEWLAHYYKTQRAFTVNKWINDVVAPKMEKKSVSNELEVKKVPFMGTELMAARDSDGQIWAGVRWMCDGIGLTKGQMQNERNRIHEDKVLSKGERNLVLPTKGGNQSTLCLKLDYVPLWLAKISDLVPQMRYKYGRSVYRAQDCSG